MSIESSSTIQNCAIGLGFINVAYVGGCVVTLVLSHHALIPMVSLAATGVVVFAFNIILCASAWCASAWDDEDEKKRKLFQNNKTNNGTPPSAVTGNNAAPSSDNMPQVTSQSI